MTVIRVRPSNLKYQNKNRKKFDMSTIKDKNDKNDYDKSSTNRGTSRDGNRNKNDNDEKNLSKTSDVNKPTSFFSRFKSKKPENLQEKNTNDNTRRKKLINKSRNK